MRRYRVEGHVSSKSDSSNAVRKDVVIWAYTAADAVTQFEVSYAHAGWNTVVAYSVNPYPEPVQVA